MRSTRDLPFDGELAAGLNLLRQKSLLRSLQIFSPKNSKKSTDCIDFSSNDYLGLSTHPEVIKKTGEALRVWGTGSGASRLLSGNLKIHEDLERKIASFKKEKAALVYSSGYMANLGAVTALMDESDVVLLDRLNHASLVDAARLSKAKLWVYPHRDMAALSRLLDRAQDFRRRLVVTDAYFSMDGDVAPLDKMTELCRKKNSWLMVDEAHSTGVFGKSGRGLSEHFGVLGQIQVVMGTLSKALGSVGGFVAGSPNLRNWLISRSREFIYTTGPSPAGSAAALASIGLIETQPNLRKKLWNNIDYFRENLKELGFSVMGSQGPIVPVWVGDTRKTLSWKKKLQRCGVCAAAIRPPTVPKGTDRLRFSITAAHTKTQLDFLLKNLKTIQKEKVGHES